MFLRFFCFFFFIILGACSYTQAPPVSERISVLKQENNIQVNSSLPITLGQEKSIKQWLQSNFDSTNHKPSSSLNPQFKLKCQFFLGNNSDDTWPLAEPVYNDGILYALGSGSTLTAINLKKCQKLWEVTLSTQAHSKALGISSAHNTLFVTLSSGSLFALDFQGKILGEKIFQNYLRSTPTIYKDKIFITTSENQIFAINLLNGKTEWNYKAISPKTSFFEMAPSAAHQNILITPFSSGELIAFDTQTGTPIWEETFFIKNISNQSGDLSHLQAAPVIDNNIVYITSNSDETSAFNIVTGTKLWTLPITSQSTPFVSGSALFLVDTNEQVYAIDIKTGKAVWKTSLKKKDQTNHWKGPLLLDKELIFVSSKGHITTLDSLTGKKQNQYRTKEGLTYPIIADNYLVFLTNRSHLLIYE